MTTSINQAQRLGNFVHPDVPDHGEAEILRVIAIGAPAVVNQHIIKMYQLGYAEPHEWSQPLPAPNSTSEVMRILTKRIVGLKSLAGSQVP
ncbi:MAG: hypothetical protein AAGD25_02775 [Cyanobacteria bacterium P01_F01_bin.150]